METTKTKLRLALIGCGGIAGGYGEEKDNHLRALEDMGIQIHTYCDINLSAARRRLRQYGGRWATARPEQVFADPDIHAVLVCTRHDSHAALAVAAAEAGKHVFIEKPLALSERECAAIVAAGRKHRVKIMVGFSKRYTPAMCALAPLRGRARAIVVACGEPAWGVEMGWCRDPVQGGGQAFCCGSHVADMLLWLAGSEPVRIYATGGPVARSGRSSLSQVYAVVDFRNRTKGVLISGDIGGGNYLSKFSVQIYTGTGCAVGHNRLKDLEVTNVPGLEPVHAAGENFGAVMRDFVACITSRKPSPIPPEDGLNATRLIERMIASIRLGQPVPWAQTSSCGSG